MKKLSLGLIAAFFLTSCATTLKVPVERPAELDMHGAKTISILPVISSNGNIDAYESSALIRFFSWLSTDSRETRCANRITDEITSRVLNSGFFTVVPASTVQAFIKNGEQPPVDAYISATISNFSVTQKEETYSREENGVKVYYTEYYDNVSLSLCYLVVDAKTNNVIAVKQRNFDSNSDRYKDKYHHPEPVSVLEYSIKAFGAQILKELQPYTVTKSIKLEADKTKDPEMKAADQLAKAGNYDQALEQFTKIYSSTNNFAAGYNAGMILLAQEKYDEALEVMQNLASVTGDKKAIKAVNDITIEKYQKQRLLEQKNAREANIDAK